MFGRFSPRRGRSHMLLKTVKNSEQPSSTLTGPDSLGTTIKCSSAMHGSEAPRVELNRASLSHVRRLLKQLLEDDKIDHASEWSEALIPVLLQCTDDVEPDVQQGDDMDIRHYVKLKKVAGGKPGDTSYVSGVVFSKNVALKSMPTTLRNPKIAIVTFSIEYASHQTHFLSLEPVIAQEREYLNNLVGRITAIGPQVLLVQRNVSGLALRFLHEAGIVVVYNIKESVLAAVARVTQTPMIKSVDKLATAPSQLGRCDSFQVKTYMHRRIKKSYIYLYGCLPDLGCTIVLRGGDTKTLRTIKRITEFMCYVVYNLKLETYLMRDQYVSVPRVTAHRLVPLHNPDISSATLDTIQSTSKRFSIHAESSREISSKYERLEEEVRHRVLSVSPFVVFMQPYLLTQLREQEQKLSAYKMLRNQYAAADEQGYNDSTDIHDNFELVSPEMVHVPASKDQPKAVREYLRAVHEAQFEKSLHNYETQKRLWQSFMTGGTDPFDPFSHQTIVILCSTVSSITSAPCVGPELVRIGFYAGYNHVQDQFDEDCTLGQFVEDLCANGSTTCLDCGKKMWDHHKQYVHGYGQLSISVQRQCAKMRGYSARIFMWSSCRVCRAETTVIPMSESTWKYSFAKYLELSFWSSPLHPRANLCKHDIHKDFLRCFEFANMTVRVQYDAIQIYDVVVPRSTVTWRVETDLTLKNELYLHLQARLNAFTDSVRKRLDSINIDTLDEKTALEANEQLDTLRQRMHDDHEELTQKLQSKYADSRYYEIIPLNRALRFMDEKALAWDDVFSNFEHDYFPSENDIRKLTVLQLRNLFLESQPGQPGGVQGESDVEDGIEMKRHSTTLSGSELPPEQIQNAMISTVEEYKDPQDDSPFLRDGTSKSTDPEADVFKSISPRETKEKAVDREGVRHLDLAVPAESANNVAGDQRPVPNGAALERFNSPVTQDVNVEEETVTTDSKPLVPGLLERIEAIRSQSQPGETDQDLHESKIPRPKNRKQGSSLVAVAPPLSRTQSQPNQVPRRSADLSSEPSIDASLGTPSGQESYSAIDNRLSERLRIARSASKVGKVTPSLIPRSIPLQKFSDETVSSNVSALANHFEQMSREFEKERLKERRQRALRSRQTRANPLASSRPIVEVYRTANDAVGESALGKWNEEPDPDELEKQAPKGTRESTQRPPASSDETYGGPIVSKDTQGAVIEEVLEKQRHDPLHFEKGERNETGPQCTRDRDISDLASETSPTLRSPTSPHEIEFLPELSIPEHKKNVWFKYLAEFWSKRSASGWTNLEYPLHATEHVFEDSDIIVREDEPSSVIALSLASADYQVKVKEFRNNPKDTHKHAHMNSEPSVVNCAAEGNEPKDAVESSLLSITGTHMKYSFAHGQVKATCKIFYAEAFDALRRKCGVADRFVESISRCVKFDSKGGKTKSLFLRTHDQRFIIKSLQEVELKAFTKFAPDYFAFMSYTLFHGVPSVIAKMFGLYQVTIKNPATGMDFSCYLLVMENLFYERHPNRRFDLKGSMRNRKIESTGQPDEVLLDENLVETIFESPLFVREHARKLLQASVYNDTMWLCKQNVMDYSLMAGFDDERKELVVGIIDCIRTYTWDKKLESWIKDRGKNKPTITSPKDYRNRFRVSMMQYVLQAPNCWHQFQAQMLPPKTLKERDEGGVDMADPEDGTNVKGKNSVAT